MQAAQDFTNDLRALRSQTEREAELFSNMPPEGKRKCLESLEQTIATLQQIKQDLLTELPTSDPTVAQVLWRGDTQVTFTKEGFVKGFQVMHRRTRVPGIVEVYTQDDFIPDADRFLQPVRTCFVRFSTPEEACAAMALEEMIYVDGMRGFNIRFIPPTQASAASDTYRRAGRMVARLGEIGRELRAVGAVRDCGTVPRVGPAFADKSFFLGLLAKARTILANGHSLDHHTYAPLAGMRPVDTPALQAGIKALYDEECGLLIQLREMQMMDGVEFEFQLPFDSYK